MKSGIKIFKNFLSKEEISTLNDWTLQNKEKDFFTDANMGKAGTRMTTRFSKPELFSFPKTSYSVQERIIKLLNITDFKAPPFKDGIVSGIGTSGGGITPHTDPRWFPNTYTLHCNILTQKPFFGGNMFVNNKEYGVEEGDMLCFDASSQHHHVENIVGSRERVLWIFGFCVPQEFKAWEED